MKAPQRYALSVGTVTFVDYALFTVTLKIETGETLQPTPIPLTFPGAGKRHFFGALPEVGDVAVIGWAPQESGYNRRPVVLGWMTPSIMAGQDWMPFQPYSAEEWGHSPSDQVKYSAIADRTRHKLRHMEPGDIVASSSRGADIVLNESVLITNRRANEIRLRDQDQALIIRSLQQFHAMAGARIYAGMVQRDANLLPVQMFADLVQWDAPRQVDGEKVLLQSSELAPSEIPLLQLTPNALFQRTAAGKRTAFDNLIKSGDIKKDPIQAFLDPYQFLQNGLFIGADGSALTDLNAAAVYGGKSFYRVSTTGENSAANASRDTLTEYRIELTHTADGTLPVTEQTDNFDADRIPESVPRELDSTAKNAPFIEFVMGSVVGNDAFSLQGKEVYGIPLQPEIFPKGASRAVPNLISGVGSSMEEHAASLFIVRPPLGAGNAPTFWSVTKDGRLKTSIPGTGKSWSVEAALGAGLRLESGKTPSGESLQLDTEGAIRLHSRSGTNHTNLGLELSSDTGAVRIYGGGPSTVGGNAGVTVPVGGGGSPAVEIESGGNLSIKAAKEITLSGTSVNLANTGGLNLQSNSAIAIQSGDKVSITSKVMETTTTGKAIETYGGPKDGSASNLLFEKPSSWGLLLLESWAVPLTTISLNMVTVKKRLRTATIRQRFL